MVVLGLDTASASSCGSEVLHVVPAVTLSGHELAAEIRTGCGLGVRVGTLGRGELRIGRLRCR